MRASVLALGGHGRSDARGRHTAVLPGIQDADPRIRSVGHHAAIRDELHQHPRGAGSGGHPPEKRGPDRGPLRHLRRPLRLQPGAAGALRGSGRPGGRRGGDDADHRRVQGVEGQRSAPGGISAHGGEDPRHLRPLAVRCDLQRRRHRPRRDAQARKRRARGGPQGPGAGSGRRRLSGQADRALRGDRS